MNPQRLTLGYDNLNFHVTAKDTKANQAWVGGFGVFGVGKMWWPIDNRVKEYPGFEEAPEVEYIDRQTCPTDE